MTEEVDELQHIGTQRHSGRYPWGSGENSEQRNKSFLTTVAELKAKGLSEAQIAEGMGMSTTELRARKSTVKNEKRKADQAMAIRLQATGMSTMAIANQMGRNESSVRDMLNPSIQAKTDILQTTASRLKDNLKDGGYLDIGEGTENHIGISKERLAVAVSMLKDEGYRVDTVKVPQLGTTHKTTVKVLSPPGTEYGDIVRNPDQIKRFDEHTNDLGRTFETVKPPKQLNSKRVAVRYGEDGGSDMDGVIELRRGVDDISLGGTKYAQVRIAVDGTHYLKGMAMYADDLPDGVDVRFNTNKSDTGKKVDAMKKLNRKDDGSVDQENPFGAVIKPGGQKGVLNVVNEEGDWGKWSKSLSSQMLSKQSRALAKQQLDMKLKTKQEEYDEIMALTNPTVRKKLLESFAGDADSSAVHLKAAALPRQATHAILPINSLKENEIFAPNYRNGEQVVLVRFPHGGKFEIPELTVNNRNAQANSLLKGAKDAVGIHAKVAERLSGADFDGDTVLVIPNDKRSIKTSPPLAGLKNFDPKTSYPAYEGMSKMSPKTKQHEMGNVSNLITDMTIRGATNAELARAVRHSMVVIDAEKHNLNYKQSSKDNGILELKRKYQGGATKGASTLISRASSEVRVPDRKARTQPKGGPVDKTTGKLMYEEVDSSYINKAGKKVTPTISTSKMAETHDAFTLSSGTQMETVYAEHANSLKALANTARKEALSTPSIKYDRTAKAVYAPQVASLDAKLNIALKNKPLERRAQLLANAEVRAKVQATPEMDKAQLKKVKSMAQAKARARTGAEKQQIVLTDSEWNAIQAGAISPNKLSNILDNADLNRVKELATPRQSRTMTPNDVARAKAMVATGHTQAEIASALGVSTTTLNTTLS